MRRMPLGSIATTLLGMQEEMKRLPTPQRLAKRRPNLSVGAMRLKHILRRA